MHDRKHDIQLIATELQFINLWIIFLVSGLGYLVNRVQVGSLICDEICQTRELFVWQKVVKIVALGTLGR
jgi:hypothetical protein